MRSGCDYEGRRPKRIPRTPLASRHAVTRQMSSWPSNPLTEQHPTVTAPSGGGPRKDPARSSPATESRQDQAQCDWHLMRHGLIGLAINAVWAVMDLHLLLHGLMISAARSPCPRDNVEELLYIKEEGFKKRSRDSTPASSRQSFREFGSNSSSNVQVVKYQFGNGVSYQDSVMVTLKGLDLEVVKIITAFTSVDLSNNKFQGKIPISVVNLKLLRALNFSQNGFNGSIPASLENLTVLESLDLSRNKLSGEIPWEMSKLTFLEVLNLSQNSLFGTIPQSQQFLTFTNSSFLENIGLCGLPLSTKCEDNVATPPSNFSSFGLDGVGEIDLEFMWMGFGIGVAFGFGVIFWTLALWRRGSRKYTQLIDRMFVHNFSMIPSYVHW